jgi:hypothetical protein
MFTDGGVTATEVPMTRFSLRAIVTAMLIAGGALLANGQPAEALPLASSKQAPGAQAAAMTGELVQRTGNVSFSVSVGHRPRHYGYRSYGYRPVYGYRPSYGYRPVYRGYRPAHYGYRPVYRSYRPAHYGYRPVYRPRTVCRVTYRRVWSSYYGQMIVRPVRVCSRRW